MTAQDYYARVLPRLREFFRDAHYVAASGRELLADGWDPGFLVTVRPVAELEALTAGKGLEVHLPVVGRDSASVLMPLDIDIYLGADNGLIYRDRGAQRAYFRQAAEVAEAAAALLRARGIPYLLDYTPSGAHILWLARAGTRAGNALEGIGLVEDDLARACRYRDPADIKRAGGTSLAAARMFSGHGKLAEYLCLRVREASDAARARRGELPIAIGDSAERCVNFDLSWAEGSPFMRAIRSPLSLHRKNRDRYGIGEAPPMADVVGARYDGRALLAERPEAVEAALWSVEAAAALDGPSAGGLPEADDSLLDLIDEYRRSALCAFHARFEASAPLPRGAALARALREELGEGARELLERPNPAALQPRRMRELIRELVLERGWAPRHAGNLLRDLYDEPRHGWRVDFLKYPADAKANFWARAFAAEALVGPRTGPAPASRGPAAV